MDGLGLDGFRREDSPLDELWNRIRKDLDDVNKLYAMTGSEIQKTEAQVYRRVMAWINDLT